MPFSDVPLYECEIREDGLELAPTINEQFVNREFHPDNYEDEVLSRMMELIQQKVDGQEFLHWVLGIVLGKYPSSSV